MAMYAGRDDEGNGSEAHTGDLLRLGKDPRVANDLRGYRILPRQIRHNSKIEYVYGDCDRDSAADESSTIYSQLSPYRQRLRELLVWARDERGLTAAEIATILRFLEGYTQAEVARLQSVSRQAVLSRLNGRKAPGGGRWGGIFNKAPQLIKYCERAAQFRDAHGTTVSLAIDAADNNP